jgi:hypothetical protein
VQLEKYMTFIGPYIGFVILGFGLIMTFFGSRFILFVFAGLVGLAISTFCFLTTYNLVLGEKTATIAALGGTVFVSVMIGSVFSYLSYRFAKNWAIAIVAAWGGIAIFVPLGKVLGFNGSMYTFVAAILGAVLGFIAGKQFNVYVRSIGTAIIGAFLSTRGLGSLVGNYPSETEIINNAADGKLDYNSAILGYAATMVILAVLGSIVQIKNNRDIPEDDVFGNEDEAKGCC